MTNLNPTNISNNSTGDKIKKFPAIDKLFSLLINSDDHKRKIQAIDALTEIYTGLQGHTKTDFEVNMVNLFIKTIQNEKFVYMIQHINKVTKQMKLNIQDNVMNEIIKRYVLFYDVVPKEVKFLIDLDYLDPSDPYNRKYRLIERFKNKIRFNSIKKLAYNDKGYLAIKQNHIIGIRIQKKIKIIPESIGALKNLKFMQIYAAEGIKFPKSLETLSHLKNFSVISGCQVEIPPKIKKKAQKYFNQRYLLDGVYPDDAKLLANLDMIGCDLYNLEKDELYQYDQEWYNMGDVDIWDYRLDEFGNVIEIYIRPREGRGFLTYFPKEFCFFKNLKVLVLEVSGLKSIPREILNLRSLKNLHITNVGKDITRVPKDVKNFLDSIEYLTLNINFIVIP